MPSSKKKSPPPRRRRKSAVPHWTAGSVSVEAALVKHQAGEYEQAKQLYCKVLAREPANANAWHLLGMMLYSTGHHADALDCVSKAITIVPNDASMQSNLGLIYSSLGQFDDAIKALERAITLDPQFVAARNNLGTVLMDAGLLESAETHLQMALQLDPDFADAAMNLGNVWQRQGRLRDAETIYRQCLEREPKNPLALTNLGESLRQQCNWTEAAEVFTRAIQLNPNSVETQLNLGRTYLNLSRHDEALAQFRDVAERLPRNAKAHHYLGKTLHDVGDVLAATKVLSLALEIDPADAYAQSTLGFVYLDSGQRELATECFRRAIELNPAMSESHGCLLYIMSGDPMMSPQQLYSEHVSWGKMHGAVPSMGPHRNVRQKGRRLRIGYVSPDFRNHAVAKFIQPVLESHDCEKVELFCYAEVAVPDETTAAIRGLSNHWRVTTGLSDQQVAQQIATDKIDILVDLAGHTSRNRLLAFAYKPAPIQMTWLGYPNTTGLNAIDYRLTCDVQNPVGEDSLHTERLIRMNGGSFCFTPPVDAPNVGPPPVQKNGFITFGSLHRPFKISEQVQALWARVLLACPTSRLLAFNTRFTDESEAALRKSLVQYGIDPHRITIRNHCEADNYLQTYQEIDLTLDVFPWAGGTTTLEALWMGVPVVARYGDRRSSRSTAAIVGGIDRPNWIAYSDEEYVQLSKSLAIDIPQLCRQRKTLRQQTLQTIADSWRFTRELEGVYQQVWNDWCDKPPA
ncbi:MAG: tetratricopeptide repeat protein [Pirellulaceae bacterium]